MMLDYALDLFVTCSSCANDMMSDDANDHGECPGCDMIRADYYSEV